MTFTKLFTILECVCVREFDQEKCGSPTAALHSAFIRGSIVNVLKIVPNSFTKFFFMIFKPNILFSKARVKNVFSCFH